MIPKVFVSHASEDKDRFVLDFAQKLREKGIDAWIDKWEMLAGDSLVDKIFEEGIKNATSMIIILSKYSVDKPWVKEELNTGFVNKINKGTKLIPVILDNCKIPECLLSIKHQKINNTLSYESELISIVDSIFGNYTKPPIGKPPNYVSLAIDQIPNLTKVDTIILKSACEISIQNGHDLVNINDLLNMTDNLNISHKNCIESLEILDHNGYIKLSKVLSMPETNGISHLITNYYGFDEYCRYFVENYDKLLIDVVLKIINDGARNNDVISQELVIPIRIIDHIFKLFEQKGFIEYQMFMGGHSSIYNVNATMRRWADSL